MNLTVKPLEKGQEDKWNLLVEKSNEGTIFHRLDFLAYHGDRFNENEHHLVFYNGDTPCGVMPMAIFEEEVRKVGKSPYGGTYGGPVFDRVLNYSDSMQVVTILLEYLRSVGVSQIRITLPIQCCYSHYSETFRLALLEHKFICVNRDISSVVCLDKRCDVEKEMSSRSRNVARKARKAGVAIQNQGELADFWGVLEKTYKKLEMKPTHTREELSLLTDCFPSNIYFDVAYVDEMPVAGVGCFAINKRVNSSFYLCQDPEYQQTQALSLLIYEGLIRYQNEGYQWFDFGTSSANQQGRGNIFSFKESFGAVGQFRETYIWDDK